MTEAFPLSIGIGVSQHVYWYVPAFRTDSPRLLREPGGSANLKVLKQGMYRQPPADEDSGSVYFPGYAFYRRAPAPAGHITNALFN